MEFKNVALIGAGAVGAYFIYGFTDLEGLDFCVVADGERYDRLVRDGITINDTVYRPAIKTPEEAHGADLLLVCTKYDGLFGVLDMIEKTVDEHTVVMSLLNGIDSEQIIAERIGDEHLLYSVMRISAERRNGQTKFKPETTVGVSYGEKDGRMSERVIAFKELMNKAGLRCKPSDDIIMDQWNKYSMNIIHNLPQAILDVGFGAYYDSDYVATIKNRMFDEVRAVANAEGVPLKVQQSWREICLDTARFSTLQDIDAKRHTEIEMLAGVLIGLAKKHGIEVPFMEYTYLAIKAIEEKNDGKFDY